MRDLIGAMRMVNVDAERAIQTFILAVEFSPDIFQDALGAIWNSPFRDQVIANAQRINEGQEPVDIQQEQDVRNAFLKGHQTDSRKAAIAATLYDNLLSMLFANTTQRRTLGKKHLTEGYIDPQDIIINRYNQLQALNQALHPQATVTS